MTGHPGRAYSRLVILPAAPDLGLLLVRTDYLDDRAWNAALSAATAVYETDGFDRMGAVLRPVESPALANLTPEELVALEREGYLGQIAVADAQTMQDQTVLFVDFNALHGQAGRTFRSIASEVEPIVANLLRQPRTAPDRMNARTRGKMWQNSPPPHESTSPPARSIASHKGSADWTRSSAVADSTSSTAHTASTISRRDSAGRSASESRSTVAG